MGVRNLTGSPWHLEYLKKKESDSRRHRSRCKHFNQTSHSCNILARRCYDSSHCSHYFEKERKDEPVVLQQNLNDVVQNKELYELSYSKEINEQLYIGNIVEHIKLGMGRIISIDRGLITILFPKHGEKTLSLKLCIENKLITF